MKTPNFTKGPWRVSPYGMCAYYIEKSKEHEQTANTHLIASAPEMFETLEACLVLLQDPNADEFSANTMEAKLIEIIKKARGE